MHVPESRHENFDFHLLSVKMDSEMENGRNLTCMYLYWSTNTTNSRAIVGALFTRLMKRIHRIPPTSIANHRSLTCSICKQ